MDAVVETKNALSTVTKDGKIVSPSVKSFLSKVDRGTNCWAPNGEQGHSVELSFDDFDEDEAHGFIESFIKQIKKDLTTRFTDCSLLSCFKIFDPSSYVETDTFKRPKLGDYGLADLHKLLKRFCGKDLYCKLFTANPQSIYQEFNSMKLVLWSAVNQDLRASSSFASVWAKVADEDGHNMG